MRHAALVVCGLVTAGVVVACAEMSSGEGDNGVRQSQEPVTLPSSGFTYGSSDSCGTAHQVAAAWVRATIEGLGRWRPGLDFTQVSTYGQPNSAPFQYVALTPNGKWPYNVPVPQYADGGSQAPPTPGTPQVFVDSAGKQYQLPQDLDGDGRLDGQAYCNLVGTCGEFQMLLALQSLNQSLAWTLENSPLQQPFWPTAAQRSPVPRTRPTFLAFRRSSGFGNSSQAP